MQSRDVASEDRPASTGLPRTFASLARRHGVLVAIMLLAATLLTLNVRTPFWGLDEGNGVVFTGVAANHLRLGLGYTKGQDVLAITEYGIFPKVTEVPDLMQRFFHGGTQPLRYGDHPPLLGLTEAAAIGLFGEHFAVARAVPILYALFGLLLLYLLAVRLFDLGVARLAAVIYATFPIFAFFGRNICHESPTLFFGLAFLTGYVWWRDDRPGDERPRGGPDRRWWAALMVVSVVLGGGYGWPMFYLVALLFGFDWISRRRFDLRLGLLTLLPAGLTFIAVIAQIAWAFNGDLTHLTNIFFTRSGSPTDGAANTIVVVERLANIHGVDNFGKVVVWLAPLTVAFLIARLYRERLSLRTMILAVLLGWGVLHILLFRQGAWEHVYWQFYLIPFMALGLAWPVVEYTRGILEPAWQRSAMFLVAAGYLWAMNADRILALYSTTDVGVVPVQTLWQSLLP